MKNVNLGNCLVTGGNGMLGYAFVKLLNNEGIPVRVLDLELLEGIPGVDSIVRLQQDGIYLLFHFYV